MSRMVMDLIWVGKLEHVTLGTPEEAANIMSGR